MAREFDPNMGSTVEPQENPEARWIAWAVWSGLALIATLVAVLFGGMNSVLLLGWAFGIIVSAMLMLFSRRR